MRTDRFQIVASFLADLWRAAGGRLPRAAGVSAACALLEGAGLLLLAPILVASGLLGNAGTASAPWLAEPVRRLGLEGLLLAWLACVAGIILLGTWRDILAQTIRERSAAHWRLALHDAALGMEWKAFQTRRPSDIVAAMTQSATRSALGVVALVHLFAKTVLILAQAAAAFLAAPLAAAAAGGIGILFLALQAGAVRGILARSRNAVTSGRDFQSVIGQHLAGAKLAKAHGAEPGFHAAFRRVVDRWGHDQNAAIVALARTRAVGRLLSATALTAVAWTAVRHTGLAAPELLVLVAVLARLLPTVADAAHQAHSLAESLPAWSALTDLRQDLDRHREIPVPAFPPNFPSGDLELDRVGFTWPGRDRPALSDLSLTVAANRTTALVGPSGGGKSTIVDLCIGLLAPDSGQVRLDCRSIDDTLRAVWRRQVAYVPQEGFLLHDTVRANLLWLAPDAGEEDLWEVLRQAILADVIRALPQGLDTVIGDRGVRLSGGERQRLAVARALLRRPRFLVLDEATSHLDPATEGLLRDTLAALHGRMTILVVAHRLDTIRHADRIAVIADGRVREHGTWEELVARPEGWLARHHA